MRWLPDPTPNRPVTTYDQYQRNSTKNHYVSGSRHKIFGGVGTQQILPNVRGTPSYDSSIFSVSPFYHRGHHNSAKIKNSVNVNTEKYSTKYHNIKNSENDQLLKTLIKILLTSKTDNYER